MVVTFVIVFAGLGTMLILSSHAATPTASIEAESGTVSSAASAITDTTASGSGAVKFGVSGGGGASPTSFPNATNTGYAAAPDYPGSLTTFTGTFQSNHTYNFMKFPSGAFIGSVDSPVSNVTFHGCLFLASGDINVALFGDNITFDYSTFAPAGATAPPVSHTAGYTSMAYQADGGYNAFVQQLTVTHSDFWGFANAIDLQGSTQAKPQVFRDNYFHDARADGNADHTDAIGCQHDKGGTGSYMILDHNTIESVGNTNGIAFQGGTWSHIQVTGNLIGGWGYAVHIGDTTSYITFTAILSRPAYL